MANKIIQEKGIPVSKQIDEIIQYSHKCLTDKYNKSSIDCKPVILGPETGLGFNIGNAVKYLSRYINKSGNKARNRSDLIKAIHYILFEMKRTDNEKM